MIATRHASLIGLALTLAGALATPAWADPITKDQCVDAHGRGQDARDSGKITLARKLFLTCAQPACPSLVQGDCARLADDLSRQQSSLTFVARDAQGADLPDTTVYVDDLLVVTRLDDGKSHDVDPGRHTVRFNNNGKEQSVTLVVGAGEKARSVVVTFGTVNPPVAPGGAGPSSAPVQAEPRVVHPVGARIMLFGGLAVAAAGTGIAVVGRLQVPKACDYSTRTCNAPAGDPVFNDAQSGARLYKIGLATAIVGGAATVGGAIWYFTNARVEEDGDKVVMPIVSRTSAGLSLSGSF